MDESAHLDLWINVKGGDGTSPLGPRGHEPELLGRRGWTKHTINPGDHVKVVFAPLKSGEPGGTLMRATLADGTEMVNFGRGRRAEPLAVALSAVVVPTARHASVSDTPAADGSRRARSSVG